MCNIDRKNYNGIAYYRLWMRCPVCVERGKNVAADFWQHNYCGSPIYAGSNGSLRCFHCDFELNATKFKYGCPDHSDGEQTKFVDLEYGVESIAEAIGSACQMVRITGRQWLIEFIKNLE